MAEEGKGTTITQTARDKRLEMLNDYLADSKNKSYFVGAVTTIFFVTFMLFGVIPSYRAILSQNGDNREIEDAINKADQKIADMRSMIAELESDSSVINKFETAFPNEFSQDDVTKEIYGYAEQNSSFVKDINFYSNDRSKTLLAEFGTTPQIDYVAVEVRFEGTKDGLGRIIQNLENSARIFNIQNINLVRKSNDDIELYGLDREYDLDVVMEYFYYRIIQDPNVDPNSEQIIPGFITINN